MALAARLVGPVAPRYGAPSDVARMAGLSTKTVRRLVESGEVPAFRVGRRVLVAYADAEAFIRQRRVPTMATVHRHRPEPDAAGPPYVPPLDPAALARRNAAAVALLDSWEAEGDEREQRETLEVLARALGPDRVASSRALL